MAKILLDKCGLHQYNVVLSEKRLKCDVVGTWFWGHQASKREMISAPKFDNYKFGRGGHWFWRSHEVLQALKERKRETIPADFPAESDDIYGFGRDCWDLLIKSFNFVQIRTWIQNWEIS